MDSENRLWRFQKPEWLNNSTVRTAGVYVSGALVRSPSDFSKNSIIRLTRRGLVLTRLLLPHRRLRLQRQSQKRLKRACEIRRLDSRHLFCVGHVGYQLHREIASECR